MHDSMRAWALVCSSIVLLGACTGVAGVDAVDGAYRARRDAALERAIESGSTTVWTVPYQGVIWSTGSMTEVSDLFPAGTSMSVDANGSGTPTTYTGITFH